MSIQTSVNQHKFRDYRHAAGWRMVTWWSFESEYFNVEIWRYAGDRLSKAVKLSVKSHSGSRSQFKLQTIKLALVIAVTMHNMNDEIAMEFEAACDEQP